MSRNVTSTDRAIIRLLQQNARISYADLSRATGIPESTVRRRMDRLQQRGIIQFAMLADPAKLGYEIGAIIGLRVELKRLTEVAETLRTFEEVTFAAFVTGSVDIMAQVVVRSQKALVEFLTERIARIDGVRSSETFVMPWVIKPLTSWILPEEGVEGQDTDSSEARFDDEDDSVVSAIVTPPTKRGRPRKRPAAG
jgi:Lrp/AsnC family transcriptional regulator for asnA, asnC and gidA